MIMCCAMCSNEIAEAVLKEHMTPFWLIYLLLDKSMWTSDPYAHGRYFFGGNISSFHCYLTPDTHKWVLEKSISHQSLDAWQLSWGVSHSATAKSIWLRSVHEVGGRETWQERRSDVTNETKGGWNEEVKKPLSRKGWRASISNLCHKVFINR